MTSQGLLNFQILEKLQKIKFFTSKNIHGSKFRLSIVFWLRYIALKFLWGIWESDVKEGPPFHTFLHIFYKTFTILLYNKKLHKKFDSCQRWRHSEKTKTGITFDLEAILICGFFKSHIFWSCFSWKNKITCFFWSAVPL